ncbi:cytochrome c oxidase assembly protein [Sciscionella marina]|uniref:cytochrome c oxidase assembly protein n=1 Tax=Sciscionella marina TaxID=508770 RepID=UPI0003811595|nr:cytochrome c oxidase assembly protein [Sciscionella marina]
MPPLTPLSMLSTWTLDIPVLVVLAACAAGYALGVARHSRGGRRWPVRRTRFFLGFLLSVVLVTMSFIGPYGTVLFWPRAVQTVILLMVTPLLLALSAPLTLILETVAPRTRALLRRIGRSTPARALTFPLVITVVLIAPTFLLYLTPLFELSLRSTAVHELCMLMLVLAGFGYFWTRVRVDPAPRADSHAVSLWISVLEVVADGVLGLVIWLGPLLAHDYYQALDRHWGPDERLDQSISAGILWIGGDVAGLPFLGVMMTRWRAEDDKRAAEIDRELDEDSPDRDDGMQDGLWWENDPVLAERFRRH